MNITSYLGNKDVYPQIYVYKDDKIQPGCLKIGYTKKKNVVDRIKEQYNTAALTEYSFEVLYHTSAIRENGTYFTDHEVHKELEKNNFERKDLKKEKTKNSEWFNCSLEDAITAINAVKNNTHMKKGRFNSFKMRPEQEACVKKTAEYFRNSGTKFLWNAKMRFGKTFTTYELMKEMNWNKILILTFKPVVEDAWKEDLNSHIDFEGYKFCSVDETGEFSDHSTNNNEKLVVFASLQNILGKDKDDNIKEKNRWIHSETWDCIVLDEYHYGSWRDKTTQLLIDSGDEVDTDEENIGVTEEDISNLISSKYRLFLSGTPFRALNSGEFIEEQIYSWTYQDEQLCKKEWPTGYLSKFPDFKYNPSDYNPYEALPELLMFTYTLPDSITSGIRDDYNEFDLGLFFKANKNGEFIHNIEVQNWLNILHNSFSIKNYQDSGSEIPPLPYSDPSLQELLVHTVWYLPSVNACNAMGKLLKKDTYFRTYEIINCSGDNCGDGIEAKKYLDKRLNNKPTSITLTCGKLLTGVTVKKWTGIFMLTNLKTPESYFQSAFRVQSPNTLKNRDGEIEILKYKSCIFDFSPKRALRQIAIYANDLDVTSDRSSEYKVGEFIKYLPILCYDGAVMTELNASDILQIAYAGTTATLLAKGWQNASMVNLDSQTLANINNNKEALEAINKIEGFRSLGVNAIPTVINQTTRLENLRTKERQLKINNSNLTEEEIQEKNKLEKELRDKKGFRKRIQEKLIKFLTRIPIFMYLTDYREQSLKDVILKLDSELFEKTTNLTKNEFRLLVDLNLFNNDEMNQKVYNFRVYEDSSLSYCGIDNSNKNGIINKHSNDKVIGVFNTTVENDIKEQKKNSEDSFNKLREENEKEQKKKKKGLFSFFRKNK